LVRPSVAKFAISAFVLASVSFSSSMMMIDALLALAERAWR